MQHTTIVIPTVGADSAQLSGIVLKNKPFRYVCDESSLTTVGTYRQQVATVVTNPVGTLASVQPNLIIIAMFGTVHIVLQLSYMTLTQYPKPDSSNMMHHRSELLHFNPLRSRPTSTCTTLSTSRYIPSSRTHAPSQRATINIFPTRPSPHPRWTET